MQILPDNIITLQAMISPCRLCPRGCGVDRTAGEVGFCRIGAAAKVASVTSHFGEERVLVGSGGSGTIFFSGCNLDCVFCQNADISHSDCGQMCGGGKLADMCLSLAGQGCENINFVTPTHVSHVVAEAIFIARERGLTVPTVYNCGGYESVAALKRLEGLIDIYMPDFKYTHAAGGKQYSGVDDYPEIATEALEEMYRQVGPLDVDERGLARRGVMVRHLVMPGDLADSRGVVETVARTAPGAGMNVMGQYRPAYHAGRYDELLAGISDNFVRELRNEAETIGLVRTDH